MPPEDALFQSPALTLLTIPSSDRAFGEFVRRLSDRLRPRSPADLQARLRGVYPRVLVRSRNLSSDDHIWYVYREGRWVADAAADWWTDESMPRLELDKDGFIATANPAAGEALGVPPNRLAHRHFTDFSVPGSLEDAILIREVILDVGEAGGTIQHLRDGGEVRIAEFRAVANASGSAIVIRPIGPTTAALPELPSVEVDTKPERDRLFATVVQGIVSRIPEPTPAGLELRLRLSYPFATVEATDDGSWQAVRDPRTAPPPIRWDDPGLARTLSLDTSLIVEANEPALALLGRDLVGRHWHELAVPSTLDQRLEMRDFYVAKGGAESTFRLIGARGELVDYDYRLTWQRDRFTTVMAPFVIEATDG